MISWSNDIVEAVARRKAVLVLGSGVSANSVSADGRRPPTWGAFLADAFNKLERKPKYIRDALKQYRYLEACDYLRSCYGAAWEGLVRAAFLTPGYKHAPIHEFIFELDCRIVISMNFDRIYEGYADPASENTLIVKNYYDPDIRQVAAGSDRYLLKPHGGIDSISKMIFTAEDYAQARVEHRDFYEFVMALLHTHLFICIGCGLSDPDLQQIFETYRYKHGEAPHVMTLPAPFNDAEARLVKKTRGLSVLKYADRDNHKELTESLQQLAKIIGPKRDIIAAAQDW